MGRGGEAQRRPRVALDKVKALGNGVKADITVLKTIWFSKAKGDSHADRLETFYAPQAQAYDRFRRNFLWGREPLLAACAARLRDRDDVVWVDLGGGTGENVQLMDHFFPIKNFKSVYVVDLCPSLCREAEKKVEINGWDNVRVMETDACTFVPEEKATLVTFSYSLSMIPPFYEAVDKAMSYLEENGLFGICDFYVSGKYDHPLRQMSWGRRFFWRSIFDMDNIDLGPERRNYLDHRMDREWEFNGQGSIPYVPLLRVPWYVWIGRKHCSNVHSIVRRARAPPLFPPTFLYTMSWEDPDVDATVLDINPNDVCLTLTSGGCNSLNLVLHGAKEVYSVDCSPAQTALLELKAVGIERLDYDSFWKMFGEGKMTDIDDVYKKELMPFMTQNSIDFWNKKLYHFRSGLYYAGGMGKICWMSQYVIYLMNMTNTIDRLTEAETLEDQIAVWDGISLVRFFKSGSRLLVSMVNSIMDIFLFNRFALWYGGGVPVKQYRLLLKDGYTLPTYVSRTFDGVARWSHLKTENYFYYNCLKGRYRKENCPAYLKEENFGRLKNGMVDRLFIKNGTFNGELGMRKYSKVILMDHVDWLSDEDASQVISLLSQQVIPDGRVIFRSASLCPPYVKMLQDSGFNVQCIKRADRNGYYMDRVNMYNSFYLATKI